MLRRLCLALVVTAAVATPVAAEPARPCQLGFDGCYLDADGTPRLAAPVYRDLTSRRDPAWLRAALEEGMALGSGTAWYWIDRERQVADWDFPSIKQRLTFEAWRFDNNPFDINFFWHPFNGTAFHWIARSNDLSLAASVGYGFATSMVWEYLLEFREKVSINDVIATPAAGVTFGEFLHWFGRYLGSAPGPARGWHPALRWTAGLLRSFHNAVDGASDARPGSATDELGLSADYWHRFRLSTALGAARSSSTEVSANGDIGLVQLHARAELAALPGYRRPGKLKKVFADGNITRVRVDLGGGSGGGTRDVRADTLVLGWHSQDLPDPRTDRVGHAVTVAASLSYHYQREDLGGYRDRVCLIHLPGAAIEGLWRGPGWQLEAGGRAWFDFAGLDALAYPRWKTDHADAVEKTILRKHGYYYGWGGSAYGWLELTLPRVELGASLLAGRYDSQEGYDRSQEEIEDDIDLSDRLTDAEAWLRVFPDRSRWYLEGRLRHQRRDNTTGGLDSDQSLRSYWLELGVEL